MQTQLPSSKQRGALYLPALVGLVMLAMAFIGLRAVAVPGAVPDTPISIQQLSAPAPQPPSAKNNGLATVLGDIVKAKGDYAIAVVDATGKKQAANGDKQYVSASTYKLFVAYAVFKQIYAGKLAWPYRLIEERTVDSCFEAMIVNSNNTCAKAFGQHIGWPTITTMMHDLGLVSTHVETDHHRTTANDLALFLAKLQDGSLLSTPDSDKLLDTMKRQVYRSGIPAGTGVTVANKVGFLDGLLHDAGIVYGAKGPYVLVILSDGSSWSQLAGTAKQIHEFMEK